MQSPGALERVSVICFMQDAYPLKVIGIQPLVPVQNSVSLELMQREKLSFMINLPDVENITKGLNPILTKVSTIRFYTLEFILNVQSQI